jgi:hypothetical protein
VRQKGTDGLGAVTHICYPFYSGGRDSEDHGVRPVRGKVSETCRPISTNKAGMVVFTCNPS